MILTRNQPSIGVKDTNFVPEVKAKDSNQFQRQKFWH